MYIHFCSDVLVIVTRYNFKQKKNIIRIERLFMRKSFLNEVFSYFFKASLILICTSSTNFFKAIYAYQMNQAMGQIIFDVDRTDHRKA